MKLINIDGHVKQKTCVLIEVTIFSAHLLNGYVELGGTLDLTTIFGKRFLLLELSLFLHKCFCWDYLLFKYF